ncbi:hypothetical protein CEXT_374251 [Caerostris extrusa]|uniref:Uncharacterized protein n=1 Tax=Caerostris extrusa TaxID=172846 RepID=A0AAV4YBD2_CAEEX|nr:hypothetical protein CEXT_374251 [Caerostris extrusa]
MRHPDMLEPATLEYHRSGMLTLQATYSNTTVSICLCYSTLTRIPPFRYAYATAYYRPLIRIPPSRYAYATARLLEYHRSGMLTLQPIYSNTTASICLCYSLLTRIPFRYAYVTQLAYSNTVPVCLHTYSNTTVPVCCTTIRLC